MIDVRDWLAMRPEDFDTDIVPTETLFDLEVSIPATDDGHGTGDILEEIDREQVAKRAQVTYEQGWRDFDRGGSHRVRRRRFGARVNESPEALSLWDSGWADNQHGRGFGTSIPNDG